MSELLGMHDGSFSYNGNRAVYRDISFSVEPGEVYCILGPNGCGKTTLLDTLLGHHDPVSGMVSFQGRNAADMSARERALALSYVPQNHEKTFPYLVEQVVLMGRAPHLTSFGGPGKEDYRMVGDVMDMMNISHLRHKEYTRLSGGETQLVLIARAVAQESRVMILDEPTSHLDFTNELLILETLVSLVAEGNISVIMASHVPNHAFFFENRRVPVRVALMQDGGIRYEGTPMEILTPETLAEVYGVDARVISYACGDDERPLSHVVPLSIRGCS